MTAPETKSKYARKKGRQMYGPGCCGHDKPQRYNQDKVVLLQRIRRLEQEKDSG